MSSLPSLLKDMRVMNLNVECMSEEMTFGLQDPGMQLTLTPTHQNPLWNTYLSYQAHVMTDSKNFPPT